MNKILEVIIGVLEVAGMFAALGLFLYVVIFGLS